MDAVVNPVANSRRLKNVSASWFTFSIVAVGIVLLMMCAPVVVFEYRLSVNYVQEDVSLTLSTCKGGDCALKGTLRQIPTLFGTPWFRLELENGLDIAFRMKDVQLLEIPHPNVYFKAENQPSLR